MTKRHAELCRVTTQDGLLLDGALRTPDQASDRLPIDAVLLVHGTGSNFTTPGVLETLAQQAVDAGLTSLRVNTRGHDLMARIPRAEGVHPRRARVTKTSPTAGTTSPRGRNFLARSRGANESLWSGTAWAA